MNDTTIRPSMYEQVSRDCFIQLICCLTVSLKLNSYVIFDVAVDGVGFNLNRHFSFSVYVVVDMNYFDYIWPHVRPLFSLLLSTDFSFYCKCYLWNVFYFKLSFQSFVGATVGFMPIRNCGVLSAFNYQHPVIEPRLGNF